MPGDTPFIHGHNPPGRDADARERVCERDMARAMRQQGDSLYAIALTTGRSKEWLRTYAGISD